MIGFGRTVATMVVAGRTALWQRRGDLGHLAISIAVRLIGVVASMAALVLSARWLGPSGRGSIATLSTWSSTAANIAALSLGQASVRHAARLRGGEWLAEALSALLAFTCVATIAAWTVVAILYVATGGQVMSGIPISLIVLGFAIVPLLVWEQYSSALITLSGRLGLFNLGQVIGRTSVLVLAVVLVAILGTGVAGFLVAMLLGQVATAMIGTSAIVRLAGGLRRPDLGVIRSLVADGLRLHLNTIGVLLFTGIDILMLQYWKGLTEVGIFQLASQLFITTLIVPQSAVLLLNSKVNSYDSAAFWRYHKMLIGLVMVLMIAGGGVLALIARPVIVALTNEDFSRSAQLLLILLVALPAATLNAMMGIQWITRGWLLQASAITLAAGVLNVIANIFLIPAYGAAGAAIATVVGIYVIPFTSNLILCVILERDYRQKRASAA